jgi:4-amino-4-deoxy-L-arabinose transferase-like glycosyltransferase
MRSRWILLAILLAGATIRLVGAGRAPLELIERDEFIPAAMTLSWDHHPIRVAQHGAVPMYFIRASGLLFGESAFGLRLMSVAAGLATALLLYLVAARWWGQTAGLTAAALLAFDRYHATISARAVDLPFDLLFIALAIYCFSRFLYAARGPSRRSGGWLYGAAAATAVGFLCKELTAMLLPLFLLSVLATGGLAWLKRREVWLAAAVFVLVVAPDLYSNMTITEAARKELFERHQQVLRAEGAELRDPAYVENGLYMSYADHLSRFRGIGLNLEPFYFYFGDAFDALGVPHLNDFSEFPFMHLSTAVVLWIAVGLSLVRQRHHALAVSLLILTLGTFVPFAVVQLGHARSVLPTGGQVLWYWVDRSALPAMLLTGCVASGLLDNLLARRRRASGD